MPLNEKSELARPATGKDNTGRPKSCDTFDDSILATRILVFQLALWSVMLVSAMNFSGGSENGVTAPLRRSWDQ